MLHVVKARDLHHIQSSLFERFSSWSTCKSLDFKSSKLNQCIWCCCTEDIHDLLTTILQLLKTCVSFIAFLFTINPLKEKYWFVWTAVHCSITNLNLKGSYCYRIVHNSIALQWLWHTNWSSYPNTANKLLCFIVIWIISFTESKPGQKEGCEKVPSQQSRGPWGHSLTWLQSREGLTSKSNTIMNWMKKPNLDCVFRL